MMKKNYLTHILNIFLHFHNHPVNRKRVIGTESFLTKLREIARIGFGILNANSNQKNPIYYITSRNMRKTITPSFSNDRNTSNQHDKMTPLNVKEIMKLLSFNWQQSKQLFSLFAHTSILKFHTSESLRGNLIIKPPVRTSKSSGETEESWGGTEQFKLILFLKNDFDEVIKKYPAVLVLFYAHWCPYCLRLKKPYASAALKAKEAQLEIKFAAFDVSINPDIADEKGVVGIPVMKFYRHGTYVTTYGGKRTPEDFFEFAKHPPKLTISESNKPDV